MAEVYMPEQRNSLSKFASMFQQGAEMLKNGKEGYAAGKSLLSKFTGGGATGATTTGGSRGGAMIAGGAAAAAPASEQAASSTFGEAMGGTILGPATAIAGGYYMQNRIGNAMDRKRDDANSSARAQIRANPAMSGTRMDDNYRSSGSVDMGPGSEGLNLVENPDRMGSIERRYNSQQTAKRDIEEAQKSLDTAGLPVEERRSIAQKLERARQQLGGKNRGSTVYT